jgi:putative transposase
MGGNNGYRYVSHTVYRILYHFVFIAKYWYQVLKGDEVVIARELTRQIDLSGL